MTRARSILVISAPHRRSLDGNQVSDLEIAQRARHRLSGCADEFRNFFVSQRHFDSGPLSCLLYSGGPGQQKPGELFLRGCGKTNRPQLVAGRLVLRGHLPGHALRSFRMLRNEALEIFPADEGNMARANCFGGHFIGGPRHSRKQAQDLARFGNSHDEGLAFARTDRQFHLPFAQDEDPPRVLPFHEEKCALRIGRRRLDCVEVLQRGWRQLAEETRRLALASLAPIIQLQSVGTLHRSLPILFISNSLERPALLLRQNTSSSAYPPKTQHRSQRGSRRADVFRPNP